MLEDTSFEPQPSPEELEQQAKQEEQAQLDAEFARRVRREVLRMQSGEAEEDIEQDEQQAAQESAEAEIKERELAEKAEKEEREEREERERKRQLSMFWSLISGNILMRKGVSKYYSQMILVAVLFFISIFVMFWSLHLDMRYSQLARTVQLSREKSVRLQEMKYLKCSHSAISAELQRRGIMISDPTRPSTIIKE